MTTDKPAVEALTDAIAGLTMRSETDAPFALITWPSDEPFSLDTLRTVLCLAPDTPVAVTSLDAFFAPLTQERDWHTEADRARVQRFGALESALETHLQDVTVYRFGSIAITVAIVGTTAGGQPLGVTTTVVQT